MTTVLYRKSLMENEELEIVKKYFKVSDSMVGIKDDLVIGRYSCVPFYTEVEKGLSLQNSKLINSFSEHNYIASFDYYWDIEQFTPKTWFKLSDVPEGGPYVVKGVTNSKKQQWNTMMFAATKQDAIRIAMDLKNDYWFAGQDIIIRKYEPLIKLGDSVNGLAFTNEWRFFFYKTDMLSHGFYWSESETIGQIDQEGLLFAKSIAGIIAEKTNFFALDIGQKVDGSWIVIECNDGQMSGFSMNNPDDVYLYLSRALRKYKNVL